MPVSTIKSAKHLLGFIESNFSIQMSVCPEVYFSFTVLPFNLAWGEKKKKNVEVRLCFPSPCTILKVKWAEWSRAERRHPAGLEKHCLVSQAGTFFVTWLKMCPNTIPITLHRLLSPTWLPSLHHSLHTLENSLLFAQPIPSPRSSLFPWLLGDGRGPHLMGWGGRIRYRVRADRGDVKVGV